MRTAVDRNTVTLGLTGGLATALVTGVTSPINIYGSGAAGGVVLPILSSIVKPLENGIARATQGVSKALRSNYAKQYLA